MARRLKFRLAGTDLVAIDLSSYDLRVARMNISPGRREITDLVSQDIQNLSEDDIAGVIKKILQELQISGPGLVAVIPSFLAITKNIEVPSRDPQEIKEIINLQASRHTPYSREEIIIDYINIGAYKQNYSKILLVIATRGLIRRQLEILDKAGISAERMAFAPEGISHMLSRAMRLSSQEAPAGIIHVDEGFTDFIISQRDNAIFIRNIPIGAQHLLAEKEKYEPKFIEEIKKSLEAYAGEDVAGSPGRLIFSGAVEDLYYLTDIINAALNIPIERWPYSDYPAISQKAARVISSSRRLSFLNAIACLLAYEEIRVDLTPEEVKLEKTLKQRSREIIKAGILLMTTFVLIYCILISKIYIKSSYLRNLSSRYNAIHGQAEKLEVDFTKNQIIRDFLSARGLSLEILSELYRTVPLDIQISYLKFDETGSFSVEGTAESMAAVFSFVDSLGKSPYFKKVETRYTRKRQQGERDLADFALSCSLFSQ